MPKKLLWAFVLPAFFVSLSLGRADETVAVRVDDHQWMRFRHAPVGKSKFKPYVDILTTPAGRNILRDGPDDHLHHHALMFAVKVDGVNFWEEHEPTAGRQVVRTSLASAKNRTTEGRTITSTLLAMKLDWLDRNDTPLLVEDRQIDLHPGKVPEATLLDWTSTLSVPEGKKTSKIFGSHYNGLGLRFDKSMDSGGRFFFDNDKIGTNIRGSENLTECRWMAYTAPLDGKPVTVAVFDTPGNFRKMTAFTMGGDGKGFSYLAAALNLHREPFELQEGQSARFRYGVCLWEGERSKKEVEAAYDIWIAK